MLEDFSVCSHKKIELMYFSYRIFAGTAVLVNYIFMVTWLPVSVSINERSPCSICPPICGTRFVQKLFSKTNRLGESVQNLFVIAVTKAPYLWIFMFTVIGTMGAVAVFYWPKFQLPDSPDFQLFSSDHPFEIYDSKFKNMFWFEKLYTVISKKKKKIIRESV